MNKSIFSFFLIATFSLFSFSCKDEVATPAKVDLRTEISLASGWDVVQSDGDSQFQDVTYHCTISKDPNDATKIIINKFHNIADAKVTAIVYDDRTIQISTQVLTGTTTTIEGTGIISASYQRIEWTYTANGTQVTAIFTPGTVTKKAQ